MRERDRFERNAMGRSGRIHDCRVAVDAANPSVIFVIMSHCYDVGVGVYRVELNASAQCLRPIGIQQDPCPVAGFDQEA